MSNLLSGNAIKAVSKNNDILLPISKTNVVQLCSWCLNKILLLLIGYEPAGLTVHPPPE